MSQETRIISFVRAARATLGWSQPDLAEHSGVSVVAIARLESGSASPRLSTVSKLKEAFSRAGIKVLDDQPDGGFTMVVAEGAVAISQLQMEKRRDGKVLEDASDE